jgi:hypothetical protein
MESQNKTNPSVVEPSKRNKFTSESAPIAGKKGGMAKNPNKGWGTTRRRKVAND